MPRDLPVGNGRILINFDKEYRLRDIYYPHVGQENQTVGHVSNFGVWVDGEFAWMGDGWNVRRTYAKESLVTHVLLYHDRLKVELQVHDVVDYLHDIYMRELKITDRTNKQRDVRLFFHHDFHISESEVGDTAYYDPATGSVVHYKKNRWFMVNGSGSTNKIGVDAWATGNKEVPGSEGTWKDAEDGELGGNPIAQGSVDSTIGIKVLVPPSGTETAHYWICFGQNYDEVTKLDSYIREHKPEYFVPRNQNYWRHWVNPEHQDFLNLPQKVVDLYKRSLLIIRTQIDEGGAIIAANDHDIVQFARDTYSYMWPRDGALVANALSKAGHRDLAHNFFEFCADVIKDEGYLMHKYNPDKSLASSWHPWIRNGQAELPIQEDETALVIWALWNNFKKFRNVTQMGSLFERLVHKGADFLVKFRDPETKLPRPSYDLWEERHGVHLFTVASVIGGLQAAANFAQALGELELHRSYTEAIDEVRAGMLEHMWSKEHNRFCRMATRTETGYDLDMNVDASMYAIFTFGALPPHDPKVKATMAAIKDKLWVKTDVGGVARYQDDYYHQVSQDIENIPGNPWFISTMWLAQYQIAGARSDSDLKEAIKIMEWVADHALPSGALAEQVHPYTNEPLSVSPLTWSHATFVTIVLEYLEKRRVMMTENIMDHTILPV